MKLSDLGKSYKELDSYLVDFTPTYKNNVNKIPLQENKFDRLLRFVQNKKDFISETPEKEDTPIKEENTTQGFQGWKYTPITQKTDVNNEIKSSQKDFDLIYDEVIKSNPKAKELRGFLTEVARRESGFNPTIQNKAGAPAWGYFQFMQSDDGKYNNIKHYAGTDVQTFLNDPKLQIESAIKLADEFERSITKKDKIRAKAKGLDLDTRKGKEAALHAMWLAGTGGFRRWLDGENPSDKQWSSTGQGISVEELINKYK